MSSISDPDLTLDDKYDLVLRVSHLPIRQQIEALNALNPFAEKAEDKDKYISLNSMIFNMYSSINQADSGKLHLDKAAKYSDETSNVDALGALYYQLGNYYYKMQDEDAAHKNYYKAISYYEQSKTKKFLLNFLYYRIGSAYMDRDDMESLARIMDRMLAVEIEDPNKIYYNNIYSFAGTYYEERAKKDSVHRVMFLDSSLYYREKAVEIYQKHKDTAPNPLSARRMASQNYWEIARVQLMLSPDNTARAIENVRKGEELMDENHLSSRVKHLEIKSLIYMNEGRYNAAIEVLKQEEKLLEGISYAGSDVIFNNLYNSLLKSYEEIGNYKEALRYGKLKEKVVSYINDTERYKRIKELNVKHETLEKELEISKLREEKQALMLQRAMYLAVSLAVVTSLIITLLYFRGKKLKREKEAAVLAKRIEEKEVEYQFLSSQVEQNRMRNYLEGLETERNRQAKELHDNVSNELHSIKQRLEGGCDKEVVIDLLGRLHAEVRSISHGLMSPAFKYATLAEIMYDYVYQQNQKNGTLFSIEILPEGYQWEEFSSELSVEVYRIMQEVVGNAIKHAKAKCISIGLELTQESLEMKISDDGRG
ncbi:hypothetical protein LJB80_00805, partial [Bacteroides sp. OttesenSCG-928-F21]|nr:hypothetical protein [Bacteroides sp. OttesenSCG-928-F21]